MQRMIVAGKLSSSAKAWTVVACVSVSLLLIITFIIRFLVR